MSLPIEEQRRRGMKGRSERYHPSSWVGVRVTRRISPYVTRIFLSLGVSANQCTVLGIVLTIGMGIALTVPEPIVWLAAAVFGFSILVLDCVDGELARSNGTASPEGTFLEGISHQFSQPYLLGCMAIGLFGELGGLYVVIVGLGAVLSSSLAVAHTQVVRSVAWEWGVRSSGHTAHSHGSACVMKILRRASNVLLVTPGMPYLPQLIVTSVIDSFTQGFELFGLGFNARLVWLTVFVIGTSTAAVLRATMTVRQRIESEL